MSELTTNTLRRRVSTLSVRRDPSSLIALTLFLVTVWVSAGMTGMLMALPFVLGGLVVSPIGAFVSGQFALLLTVSTEWLGWILIAQLFLLGVLTEPAREHGLNGAVIATVLLFLALGGGVSVMFQQGPVIAGLSVIVAVTTALYGIHRYELIQLGLIEREPRPDAEQHSSQHE